MPSLSSILWLGLCSAHLVSASPNPLSVQRRATSDDSGPATVDIPLHFDSNGRYALGVGISPGNNQQNFNFTLSTSTGVISVAGSECASCVNTNLFNAADSGTAKSLNGTDGVSLIGGSYSGSVVKDNCSMVTSGAPWIYTNQTILIAQQQANGSVFDNGISGLIGLGTNRVFASSGETSSGTNYSASFSDTIFSNWLNNNQDQAAFQFGMNLEPPAIVPTTSSSAVTTLPSSVSAGTLNWLSPDTSVYDTSSLSYKTVESYQGITFATGSQPDWTVELDGWMFKSGSGSISNNTQMVTVVDPYYPDIYFPYAEAALINAAISGSSLQTGLSSLGNQSQAWTVPCDAQFTFSVVIGSQTFSIDQSALVIQLGNGVCASGIEAWSDQTVDEHLLGALFIQQFYLIFNVGRNGTDTIGFASRSTGSKSTSKGAIIGGTIGGVLGVALLGLVAFFYIRSRHDRALLKDTVAMVEEHKTANRVEPYTLAAATPLSPLRPATHSQMSIASEPSSPNAEDRLLQPSVHPDDEIAPPAYEASESARGDTISPQAAMRTSKGEYVIQGSSHSESATSSTVPRSPTSPLVPNRQLNVCNIEE
ncbi:uncharacterized protein FIBRA_03489 [Fibroporia radiculosa]|uniref:Peptidase A1 domain-containing protein n=1 Tax=Fibroporia radiculosa TaxID=599839 RepID=J4HW08_9APHY|nr:uncharacterized protein FIBRA_03489 [Fibroporia radiculosa]CCM01437.1 predicted protein [Fibroporia radiculosa]